MKMVIDRDNFPCGGMGGTSLVGSVRCLGRAHITVFLEFSVVFEISPIRIIIMTLYHNLGFQMLWLSGQRNILNINSHQRLSAVAIPVIPVLQEAEVGGLLEPRTSWLKWAHDNATALQPV